MPDIRMPKMGDGMEEGTILRWLKQVGDLVKVEDPLAEVETDKANVEIPAEDAGVLTRIVVEAGHTVPVGGLIAVIGEGSSPEGDRPPAARSAAAESAAVAPGRPASAEPAAPATGVRQRVSPLARRLARDLGVDVVSLIGSGGGVGRIVAADVRAAARSAPAAAGPPAAPAAPVPVTASSTSVGGSADATEVPLSKMRRAIARRTVQSKQMAPHFYLVMPVEMDRALRVLEELNAAEPAQKITVNDLVVRASALALKKLPEVNATYTENDTVRRYSYVNIGVAVGTDDGLRIPVLRDCAARTVRSLSAEARDLAIRARSGALTPQEMSGGTFTISNLGMFGIEEFSAILNPPEAAILAVGAATAEVMVGDGGVFVARKRMRVTLSCDHRVVDGLLGARFLQEIKRLLESPTNLLG